MEHRVYHTGEFARRASVSIRTLRYYDKVGLLSPSMHSEGGNRLYTDADLLRLQRILALKFLGFSLEAIRLYLHSEPMLLGESLARQRSMMQEKRAQIDTIIAALAQAEEMMRSHTLNWESIVEVIQVIQMTQHDEWQNKYFTSEQRQQMEDLNNKHYTPEQREQIAAWGRNWTEEDQRLVSQRWDALFAELKRLTASKQDPQGPEAQALVTQWKALVGEFTHGSADIQQGLNSMYKEVEGMPAEQRPFVMPYTPEEKEFLAQAMKAQ